jgi:type IV secretory pathway TrbF-like protein
MSAVEESVTEGDLLVAAPLSPFHAARWARDRHVEELENKIRYLRGLALVLVALCAIAVHGAVTLARQSRIIPYIVEVDRLGRPLAYGRVEDMPTPEERHLRGELMRFIDAMRTVVTDPVAQNRLIDRSYAFTRSSARTYVDAYFSVPRNNPHLLSREMIRLVGIPSVQRVAGSANTWEVRWEEYEVPVRGGQATVRPWQGTLRTTIVPPQNDDELLVNSLGLYVTDLSWGPVNAGERVDLEDVRKVLDGAADQRLRDAMRGQAHTPSPTDSARTSR